MKEKADLAEDLNSGKEFINRINNAKLKENNAEKSVK